MFDPEVKVENEDICDWQVMGVKAIEIAVAAHENQKDKAGIPLIHHVFAVADQVGHFEEFLVAVLHDVVEESDWTLEQLKEEGFPDSVLCALDAVTKREEESYVGYIHRLANNPIAVRVKLADLRHNMDGTRFTSIPACFYSMLERYHQAYRFLIDHQQTEAARAKLDIPAPVV